MKKCEICLKKFEPLNEGKSRKYCFECSPKASENKNSHKTFIRQAFKREGVRLLGGKCFHCGIEGHQAIFDFHHKNPNEKEFGLSSEGHIRSLEKYLLELKKCVLLCKNCHALYHIGEIKLDYTKSENKLIDERLSLIYSNEENRKNKCECGNEIDYKANKCVNCYRISRRVSERPEPLDLAKMVLKEGFSEVGRKYGVSYNAIKKWCVNYGMGKLKHEVAMWYEKNK